MYENENNVSNSSLVASTIMAGRLAPKTRKQYVNLITKVFALLRLHHPELYDEDNQAAILPLPNDV